MEDHHIPEAQIARGGLAIVDVKLHHGEKAQTNTTIRNRGGTAVDRWLASGELDARQMRAIDLCQALWEQVGTVRGLTADLSRIPGGGGGSGLAQQYALDDLADLKGRVPHRYWDVFENVCRWSEPAGTAGSSLATNTRSGLVAARVTVAFVADLIVMWRSL